MAPCRNARRFPGGVLLFGAAGLLAGVVARWGIPLSDWEAWLLGSCGLTGVPDVFYGLRALEALLAAGIGAGLWLAVRRWQGRGARAFAVTGCFFFGAAWLIQVLRYRWNWTLAPVPCFAAAFGILGALGATLLLRRGRSGWARMLLAFAFGWSAGTLAERWASARIEWDSSAATAAVAANWRGEAGRVFVLEPFPEAKRTALALLLGREPLILAGVSELERAGSGDVVIADTRWTVQPSVWRFAAFFNGTCVVQRRPGVDELPENALVRMVETER